MKSQLSSLAALVMTVALVAQPPHAGCQPPETVATTKRATAAPEVTAERLAEIFAGGAPRNVAELAAMERHVMKLAERALPAVVNFRGASGVLVENRFALTAGHVSRGLERARQPKLTLHDGREFEAEPLGRHGASDAGLVKVKTDVPNLPSLPMGKSGELRPGQWCLMLGHPRGKKAWRPASVRLGRILDVDEERSVISDCTMESGDSGGPLIDMDGRIIGINSRITADLSTNVHAPIDAFRESWESLVDGKRTRGRMSRVRNDDADGPTRYDDRVRGAFVETVAANRDSVVEVRVKGQTVGFGAVVHPDGLIITKLSALEGEIECRLARGTYPARIAARDRDDDLALLRIRAQGLQPLRWSRRADLPVGSWVVTPGLGRTPLSYGIVSVPLHKRTARAVMGIRFRVMRRKAKLREVTPGSGAAAAGLKRNDVILSIDGKKVGRASEFRRALGSDRKLGDVVRLEVQRGDDVFKTEVRLGPEKAGRRTRQTRLWGELSQVRAGFSRVLQHDGVLKPEQCGGPIVDLHGDCVGINLARSSRIESLALPADAAQAKIASLLAKARTRREL